MVTDATTSACPSEAVRQIEEAPARLKNEKAGSARRGTGLRMVSGRLAAHEAFIGESEDYR